MYNIGKCTQESSTRILCKTETISKHLNIWWKIPDCLFYCSLRVVFELCWAKFRKYVKTNLCTVPLLPYRRSPDFGQVLHLKLPEEIEKGKSYALYILCLNILVKTWVSWWWILPSVFEQMWFGGEQLWIPSRHSSMSRQPGKRINRSHFSFSLFHCPDETVP